MSRPLRVGVVGMGALGSLFAARLASAGCEVWGLVRSDAHRESIRRSGLRLIDACPPTSSSTESQHKEISSRVEVFADADEVPATEKEADILVFLTKSYDTKPTASKLRLRELMQDAGVVLTLQNGMGNREILQRCLDAEIANDEARASTPVVLQGITDVGALLQQPGQVTQTGDGSVFLPPHPLMTQLSRALQDAGMRASVSDQIDKRAWMKLIANAAINPLTALFRVPNGQILANQRIQDLASCVVAESVAVAQASKIDLVSYLNIEIEGSQERSWTQVKEHMQDYVNQVARYTAANRSSMLRDVERGRQTEIDFINGYIAECGRKHNVRTALNEHLVTMIKAVELEHLRRKD